MVLIIMVQMHDDEDDCFSFNDGDNSICEDNVN